VSDIGDDDDDDASADSDDDVLYQLAGASDTSSESDVSGAQSDVSTSTLLLSMPMYCTYIVIDRIRTHQ